MFVVSTTRDEKTLAASVAVVKIKAKATKTIDRSNGRRVFRLHDHHNFVVSAMTVLGVGNVRNMACCCRNKASEGRPSARI